MHQFGHAATLPRACFKPLLFFALASLLTCGSAAAELLRNDGWETEESAAFQGGFVSGEIGAARLVPTEACPCNLETVELLLDFEGQQLLLLKGLPDPEQQDHLTPVVDQRALQLSCHHFKFRFLFHM